MRMRVAMDTDHSAIIIIIKCICISTVCLLENVNQVYFKFVSEATNNNDVILAVYELPDHPSYINEHSR